MLQCDQIWRNFATSETITKSYAIGHISIVVNSKILEK